MKKRIETERLLLRPFDYGDEAGILAFSSDPKTQEHTGDVMRTTLDACRALITDVWHPDYSKYGYGRFAVIHKEDQKIIGFNGIKFLPEIGKSDLGYRFLPKYWGQGIATESSRAILDFAFREIGLEEVIAFVEPKNPASSAVLRKLGFQHTQTAPYPGEENNGDILWYTLLKQDYEGQ
ncbi:GNAT family N-acetyltransferase [Altibacter sp. HG106]|uniref:GNAT family N-acetyltransferase n=1 Tax=Altibacter sp. HG106 TaxID=3023937 RepID=UPI002350CE95|nr:GNAT family N-acetyltransferase [Altibacter sp. HG106]MDC7993963.1 GNAT family N-acetyltransferase [Altibacter sp. HG106]